MHDKSLVNNLQKLPTASLKLRTFKYFSTSRNFHCNSCVLAEEPSPILPHSEQPTFLSNRHLQNLGDSPCHPGLGRCLTSLQGRQREDNSHCGKGAALKWKIEIAYHGREAEWRRQEVRPFSVWDHHLHHLNTYTVIES